MAVQFAVEPWMPLDYARLLAGFVGGWLGGLAAHELGHAVAARLVGFDVSAVGIGVRRPVVSVTAFGSRVYLARGVLSGGLTFAVPRRWATPRWRYAAMIAGGPAVNALLVLAFLAAYRHIPFGWDLLAAGAAAANAAMLVATLAPATYNFVGTPVTNDGGLIARVLRTPDWNHGGQVLPATRTLLPLWDGLAERRAGAYNLDVTAVFWAWLGSPAAAGAALAAADERRNDRAGPFERAVAATARGAVARTGGRPDAAAEHFAAAADLFGEAGDRDAAVAARAMRAEAASAAGDPSAIPPAERPRNPELAGMTAKLTGLIAFRIGDDAAADGLLTPSPGEDPAFAAWVCRVVAAEAAGRDPARAEAAERAGIAALVAAGRYSDTPLDRPAHVELVERALLAFRRTVAARGGNVSEATRDLLRPAYAESVRRQLSGPRPDREREGRRFLLGCTVWVLCAMVAALFGFAGVALVQSASADKWTGVTLLFSALVASGWLLACVGSVAVTLVARVVRPGSDARYGTRLLTLLGFGMAMTALGTVVIWLLHP
jgi:hypothetical protein